MFSFFFIVKKEKKETITVTKVKTEPTAPSETPVPLKHHLLEANPQLQTQFESTQFPEQPSVLKTSQQEVLPEQSDMVEESHQPQPGDSADPVQSPAEVAMVSEARVVVPTTQSSASHLSLIKQASMNVSAQFLTKCFYLTQELKLRTTWQSINTFLHNKCIYL